MAENLLDLIQRPAIIDQEAGEAMSQIVNAHLRQIRFPTEAIPHLGYGGIGLARLLIDEHMLELPLGIDYLENLQCTIIQWDCKTACKTFQGPGEKSVEKFPPQVIQ